MKTSWYIPKKTYPPLDRDIRTETLVIGGGLAGIITAYLLRQAGIETALIESGETGGGATSLTTAITTEDIDTDVADLIGMFGIKKARAIWDSHASAIDLIEKIQRLEKIECEFKRTPLFMYANSGDELKSLEEENDAIRRIGIKTRLSLQDDLGIDSPGYIELKNQTKFHPLKLLAGTAEKFVKNGGLIFERTQALGLEKNGPDFTIRTAHGTITAEKVIITTYQPFKNPLPVFMKKGMYVTYMMELEIASGLLKEASYLDLQNPYHYFRVDRRAGHDRILLGGEDHRQEIKIDPRKNFSALEKHFRNIFPHQYRVVRKWSGPILEPIDGLALIGEVRKNLYVATGFSGNGMTYSAIAGLLLRDLILGKPNPWRKLYDPKRIPELKQLAYKSKDYFGELFGGAGKNIFERKKH